jgi:hypothetical protein
VTSESGRNPSNYQPTTGFSASSVVASRLDDGSSSICDDLLLFAQNLGNTLTKWRRDQSLWDHPFLEKSGKYWGYEQQVAVA